MIPPYAIETIVLRSDNGIHDENRFKQAGIIGPCDIPIKIRKAISECAPPDFQFSVKTLTSNDIINDLLSVKPTILNAYWNCQR